MKHANKANSRARINPEAQHINNFWANHCRTLVSGLQLLLSVESADPNTLAYIGVNKDVITSANAYKLIHGLEMLTSQRADKQPTMSEIATIQNGAELIRGIKTVFENVGKYPTLSETIKITRPTLGNELEMAAKAHDNISQALNALSTQERDVTVGRKDIQKYASVQGQKCGV